MGSDEGDWLVLCSGSDSDGGDELEAAVDGRESGGKALPHCISTLLFGDDAAYGRLFKTLTALRGSAQLALPTIVVCGAQSHGKSSTLERIAQREVFPRDSSLCTRMVVRLMLRNSAEQETKARIFDTEELAGFLPTWISVPKGVPLPDAIKAIMKDFVASKHQGDRFAVDGRYELQVMLQAPNVPTIDLVDLPGIVQAADSAVPVTLAKRFLAKDHTLLLVVACASEASVKASPVWPLVRESASPAVVALTHMDWTRHSAEDLVDILNKHPEFVPAGDSVQRVVPVINRDTTSKSSKVSLQSALASETAKLTTKLAELDIRFDPKRHGIRAVVAALGDMLHEYVAATWAHAELRKVSQDLALLVKEMVALGEGDDSGRRALDDKVELVDKAAKVLSGLLAESATAQALTSDVSAVIKMCRAGRVDGSKAAALLSKHAVVDKRPKDDDTASRKQAHPAPARPRAPPQRPPASAAAALLRQAAKAGDVSAARQLLDVGADVHAKDSSGWTALRVACHEGNEEVAKLLLDNGARVHAKDLIGWSKALHEPTGQEGAAGRLPLSEKPARVKLEARRVDKPSPPPAPPPLPSAVPGPRCVSVESFSQRELFYTLDLDAETCTCPSFRYGHGRCKHLRNRGVGGEAPRVAQGPYYGTTHGKCYHNTASCSGLRRATTGVRVVDTFGLRPCKLCVLR